MISGDPYDPYKTDIWSSGVILYAMLCGYLPFEDTDTASLYRKILSGEFELPIFLSIDATNLLK
jgi:5'-AMP-activated protein kinase catalytic alpha subunit